jgi:hypothetical protein
MDSDKIDYILTYYDKLMTEEEARVWKHHISTSRLNTIDCKEQGLKRKSLYVDRGWILINGNKPKLLKKGINEFKERTASRILAQHSGEITLNTCPNCNRLARTPSARQCRHCGCDWHKDRIIYGFLEES